MNDILVEYQQDFLLYNIEGQLSDTENNSNTEVLS